MLSDRFSGTVLVLKVDDCVAGSLHLAFRTPINTCSVNALYSGKICFEFFTVASKLPFIHCT